MPTTYSAHNALAVLVLVLLAGAAVLAEMLVREDARAHEIQHVGERLEQTRLSIEKAITRDLHAVKALSTYISVHPQIGTVEFDAFAARLLDDSSSVRHLAMAPGLVVRYVYPRAGNEAALGLDYRTISEQHVGIRQAIASPQPVLAGPVELVQGGSGLIARAAVHVTDEGGERQLWGVVSAVIDLDRFYANAGLLAGGDGLEFAIRGRDGSGATGDVFYGDPAIWEARPLLAEVGLPAGTWQIAVRPAGGWARATPQLVYVIRVVALVFGLAVAGFALTRHRQERARAAAQHALDQAQHDFRMLFENANDALYIHDAASLRVIDVNGQAECQLGYSREQLLDRPFGDIHDATSSLTIDQVRERVLDSGSIIYRARHRRADGGLAAVEVSSRLVPRADGDLIISVARDITERERIEAALRQSRQDLINSIESISEGFALWGADDHLQIFNQRMLDILPQLREVLRVGISFETLARHTYDSGITDSEQAREQWLAERLRRHREPAEPIEYRSAGGRIVRVSEYPTRDGHIVGIYTDITEIKQAEEHIRYRAYFDTLTALPNRDNFMNQLVATIQMVERNDTVAALLFVDLDRFKNVNDTMGHATGDLLLQEAARRICECVRQTDTVARFGGDEFTVLLRDIGDTTNAARVAETVIRCMAAPYRLDGHDFYCGASIGITVCPLDSRDAEVLLKNADMAMYQAKALGRNTYRFFTSTMTERAEQFVSMEKELRRATGSDEFSLVYQPVVRLADHTLGGVEALLRWQHPVRGTVTPAEFISIAEETRLINDLGAWALRRACSEALGWCTRTVDALPRLALNVSSRQFFNGFDGKFVRAVLAETGFPPTHLTFEITESLLIEEDTRIIGILEDLRDMGIGLAVDDFGTGYSALGYLRRFPVTVLKIDRSFVHDIETDPSDAHLVEAIVAMARALRIDVIAEGVETSGQARILSELGCAYAQGFLYGRPVQPGEFERRFLDAGSCIVMEA